MTCTENNLVGEAIVLVHLVDCSRNFSRVACDALTNPAGIEFNAKTSRCKDGI